MVENIGFSEIVGRAHRLRERYWDYFLHLNVLLKNLMKYLLVIIVVLCSVAYGKDDFQERRKQLVQEIAKEVGETSLYLDKEALFPTVMDAMMRVPRHEFVPESQRPYAYVNRPLPIGHGQTISQPYIVAVMTDLLKPDRNHRVLEIGTGSGYQAAVLAHIVSEVYTIEIIEPLGRQAENVFKRLGYSNINTRIGDGYYGWEEVSPFDSIIVTAAASHIPPPLVKQLKPGGKMVIPVGSRFMVQQLVVVHKDKKGQVTIHQVLPVRFVPLTGGH